MKKYDNLPKLTYKQLDEYNIKLLVFMRHLVVSELTNSVYNYLINSQDFKGKPKNEEIDRLLNFIENESEAYKKQVHTVASQVFGGSERATIFVKLIWKNGADTIIKKVKKDFKKDYLKSHEKSRVRSRIKR